MRHGAIGQFAQMRMQRANPSKASVAGTKQAGLAPAGPRATVTVRSARSAARDDHAVILADKASQAAKGREAEAAGSRT